MKKNIECNSNGSNNVECNCDRYCCSRSNSYSSDSSSKTLNHDKKITIMELHLVAIARI